MSAKKVFGLADYRATWVQRSFAVKVRATGLLPCSNFDADLIVRPERVSPPMWDMVYWIEDYCERRLKPFSVEVETWWDSESTEKPVVHIRDALGEQTVPIVEDTSGQLPVEALFSEHDTFEVYSLTVSTSEKLVDCRVVPTGTFVSTIYTRRFGPAPLVECQDFIGSQCSPERVDWTTQASGEIPWPLYPSLKERAI